MKNIQPIIIATVTIIALFVVVQIVGVQKEIARNNAIDACSKISQYTKEDKTTGVKVAYPVVEVYKNCLKDKNIEVK